MKGIIFILSILMSTSAVAQYDNGYIILYSGDTVRGNIKVGMTELSSYQQVKFEKDGKTTKYTPDQVRGYQLNHLRFVTKEIGKKYQTKVFFLIHTRGYCTLYESMVNHGMTSDGFGNPSMRVTRTYYLEREGEELHPVNFPLLKQGRDLYFLDNPSLTYDIKTGKYKKAQLVDIVKRYNQERKEAEAQK
ncbi:MAG: hypothetical protein RLN86_06160 [Cyclobacteriaceae bacterium]